MGVNEIVNSISCEYLNHYQYLEKEYNSICYAISERMSSVCDLLAENSCSVFIGGTVLGLLVYGGNKIYRKIKKEKS